MHSGNRRVLSLYLLFPLALCSFDCSKPAQAPVSIDPPAVEVVAVEQRDVPVYHEWIGSLDGMMNPEIRAKASGYIIRRAYDEGSFVRKGQLLFQIDPIPYQTIFNQAAAGLAKAEADRALSNARLAQSQAQARQSEANLGKTQLDVERFEPLAKEGAITRQDLENAIQFNLAAHAQVDAASADVEASRAAVAAAQSAVEAAKAEVQSAAIDLGYTKIVAPVDGIAGAARAQVGDLVNPTSGPLVTVSTIDPIRAYFSVTEQEYLELAQDRIAESRTAGSRQWHLDLILSNGHEFPYEGKFYFTGREVDPATGAIRMAGIFPNPESVLRPGLFARIRGTRNTRKGALLIPQRSVLELQGAYQVAVVDSDDKVRMRNVRVGDRVGAQWIIEEGLNPQDRVVVEGVQKVREGALVRPKPFKP